MYLTTYTSQAMMEWSDLKTGEKDDVIRSCWICIIYIIASDGMRKNVSISNVPI